MVRLRTNVPLAHFSTFQTGGPARFFVRIRNERGLIQACAYARERNLPIIILGGGSNILIPDEGFNGLAIRVELKDISWRKSSVTVGAGYEWDRVVSQAVRRKLAGIENLSLIPGTVGGAVCQNIGAYGSEIKDTLHRVRVFDICSGKIRWLSQAQCRLKYRDSIFKHQKQYVVLAAELILRRKFIQNIRYPDLAAFFTTMQPTLASVRRAVIQIRKKKLVYPTVRQGTAGSFFKNPVLSAYKARRLIRRFPDLKLIPVSKNTVKLSAGQLIEKVGYRGYRKGKVGVSSRHALVLVRYPGGTTNDILSLARRIQNAVLGRFGILPEPEVETLAMQGLA